MGKIVFGLGVLYMTVPPLLSLWVNVREDVAFGFVMFGFLLMLIGTLVNYQEVSK